MWDTTSTWNKWTWYKGSPSQAAIQVPEGRCTQAWCALLPCCSIPLKACALAAWSFVEETLTHKSDLVCYLSNKTLLKAIWQVQDLPAINVPSSYSAPSSKQASTPLNNGSQSLLEPSMEGGALETLIQCFHPHLHSSTLPLQVNIRVNEPLFSICTLLIE